MSVDEYFVGCYVGCDSFLSVVTIAKSLTNLRAVTDTNAIVKCITLLILKRDENTKIYLRDLEN